MIFNLILVYYLLSTKGDPILPNVGNIQFGSSAPSPPFNSDPSKVPTSRSNDFGYFLNTQFGLVVHRQITPKSLYDYKHTVRVLYRIPPPSKAYELAMLKSKDAFTKYQPRQHPYCQLNSDKSYKKYFASHLNTLNQAWSDEIQIVEIDQVGRHRKQAMLAAGIGALIGFYGISHYAHKKLDENFQNNIQGELTQFSTNYKQSEKRIMDVEVHNVNSVHEYFCALVQVNYKDTSPKLAALAVDKYVNSLQQTINNALNDQLPTSESSIKALLILCQQANSHSSLPFPKLKSLCSQDVRSNLHPQFMGFDLDGSDIIMHFDVTLPIYSELQIESVYKINNLGYFNGTSRYTLNLPPIIYKTNTGKFVQISINIVIFH